MAEPMGFYTDTTVCIGCKACEVACKEWNQLPATNGGANTLSGDSYDNTRRLDGEHWRHVRFVEQFSPDVNRSQQARWLMMSDVCKHCVQAGCLEVCPTGAIIRTEFDTVVIQSDVCNGCRACIPACPFDVIEINPVTRTAQKCTLCYDRLQLGLEPACAKACPTDLQRCAYCANADHRTTGYLAPEADREGRRAVTCERCHGYLKSVATITSLAPAEVAAKDLSTLELDVAAIEAGYGRPLILGFPLDVRIVPAESRRRRAWLTWRP